jgi:hypothetical protein
VVRYEVQQLMDFLHRSGWSMLLDTGRTVLRRAQKNHLSGLKRKLMKVVFYNVQQLMDVKRGMADIVARNRHKAKTTDAYTVFQNRGEGTLKARIFMLRLRLEKKKIYGIWWMSMAEREKSLDFTGSR